MGVWRAVDAGILGGLERDADTTDSQHDGDAEEKPGLNRVAVGWMVGELRGVNRFTDVPPDSESVLRAEMRCFAQATGAFVPDGRPG